ncbi:TRAP transporter small permease [Eoetvoesiella caeni]|uniref:TRAP transporter small permease protein n=1 Tax=Eoetvoesiella caeni TaxID=645616 RepID=A0A366H2G8_9BURK|nr:TRAP transporter small permease [Eoetvoesiella caeni]MCI2808318.1 TRAP transporter small permease [Eoetvoesiella caeni]NYT53680.1 TRAP transporter small permease [Eoetvoesiella caeni]RBP35986.1 TRAP-type C4-dicarboxylate transport system permease small subunit [Eoetvoesiella caeni]
MKKKNETFKYFLLKIIPLGLGGSAATLLMLMMLLTFIDVVGRYFFNHPVNGAYELTEVLLAFVVFFALPLVTMENGHITVSLFDGWFNGAAKTVKELVINLLMVVVQGVMTWRLGIQANEMAMYGDVSRFLHIPYSWIAYLMTAMAAVSTLYSLYLALANTFQFDSSGATQ